MRTNNLVSKKQKELLALLQRSSKNGVVSISEMEEYIKYKR